MKVTTLGIVCGILASTFIGNVRAHDGDPSHDEWYKTLMMPDAPTVPCCGTADAYWADEVHVKDGKTYAVITDDREDGPLGRHHVPSGTVVEIPNNKLKWDRGNPTGHNVVFLDAINMDPVVLCFVQSSGT